MKKIDAVITWVDGQDPAHINRRSSFVTNQNKTEATNVSRFNQVDEVSLVVKSIFKFAPFVRNIYILTDQQTPKIAEESKNWDESYNSRLKIIDHKEVFKNHLEVLPTFNASTIETMIQYISGLSDQFIYFNDDMFLIKPTKKEDWFVGGKPLIRGKWLSQPNRVWYKKLKAIMLPHKSKVWSFKKAQALSAEIEGYDKKYFRTFHTPRPLNKPALINYFQTFPKLLKKQIQSRFRTTDQFLSYTLIWHYSIKNNIAITTGNTQLEEVNFRKKSNPKKVLKRVKKAIESKNILFLNLQNLDLLEATSLTQVINTLEALVDINLSKKQG
jgi:hypothetical protein